MAPFLRLGANGLSKAIRLCSNSFNFGRSSKAASRTSNFKDSIRNYSREMYKKQRKEKKHQAGALN
jgi:hypothetical protein